MSSPNLTEALAAHALGAVDGSEIGAVERLLSRDPDARAEFARHCAVVESLGALHSTPPPGELWDRISDEIEPPDVSSILDLTQRRQRRTPAMLGVAAAVLAALLGLVSILQFRHIDDLNSTIAARDETIAATSPSLDPDSMLVSLRAPESDAVEMTITVDAAGRSRVTTSSLQMLPADLVYQLWAIMDDGRVISVALLDPGQSDASFQVSTDGLAGFAVTAEVDGGVVASTNDAVVVGLIDA